MSPNEKTATPYPPGVFGKDEVLQLLGEMLSQVKPGGYPPHRPQLSAAARAAITEYQQDLKMLGTDNRSTNRSSTSK
jgi:hypothetical protein